jgi:hypothetical protein
LNLLAGVAVLWIEMRNGEIEGRSIVRGVFAGSTCRRNCVDAVAIADKTLQAFEVTRNAMMLPQAVAYSLNHSDSTASYRVYASTQIEVEGSPMYHHVKKLMYTVNIEEPDVRFGNMLLEQFGGANGALAFAMQYTIQGWNCVDDLGRRDLLMVILK